MSRRCTFIKKDGETCKLTRDIQGDPPRCFAHDPNRAAEYVAFQDRGRRGQRRPKRPAQLVTEADLVAALTWVWSEVSRQRLSKDEAAILLKAVDMRSKQLADTFTDEMAAQLRSLQRDLASLKKGAA